MVAHCAKHGGNLEADIAATDDGDVAPAVAHRLHGDDVADGSQRMHARQVVSGQRQNARSRACRQEQLAVWDGAARGRLEALRNRIEGHDVLVRHEVDALALVKSRAVQRQLGGLHGTREILFGKRRALVGLVRLVAHQHDAAIEAETAQCLGRLRTGLPCTHDHDRVGHGGSVLPGGRSIDKRPTVAVGQSAPARQMSPYPTTAPSGTRRE